MQEEGKLHHLKTRWWKEMYGGGKDNHLPSMLAIAEDEKEHENVD